MTRFPIVLVGSAYWNGLLGWLKETMLAEGNIGPEELDLFQVADDPAPQARLRGRPAVGRLADGE